MQPLEYLVNNERGNEDRVSKNKERHILQETCFLNCYTVSVVLLLSLQMSSFVWKMKYYSMYIVMSNMAFSDLDNHLNTEPLCFARFLLLNKRTFILHLL